MRITAILLIVSAFVAISCGESEPTPIPTPPPSVSATDLWAEREANASRFDLERKGTWVRVIGLVREIDDGQVKLYAEEPGPFDVFTYDVLLHDLTNEQQASAVKGEKFSAMCKVGSKVFFSMNLRDCKHPSVGR